MHMFVSRTEQNERFPYATLLPSIVRPNGQTQSTHLVIHLQLPTLIKTSEHSEPIVAVEDQSSVEENSNLQSLMNHPQRNRAYSLSSREV